MAHAEGVYLGHEVKSCKLCKITAVSFWQEAITRFYDAVLSLVQQITTRFHVHLCLSLEQNMLLFTGKIKK